MADDFADKSARLRSEIVSALTKAGVSVPAKQVKIDPGREGAIEVAIVAHIDEQTRQLIVAQFPDVRVEIEAPDEADG